ncbi:MAG: (2Fe-2S)-binding protein [Albidovulum sp.]|nr:(2Fe-2S)-binding protein [Albidovulum sp.]MDE0307311.1 (2Fe-2S)-binding protein [Albidovulum sp.]MDE0530884.1 (2Fe-2S)-binding protein [Albidovulum sp.]
MSKSPVSFELNGSETSLFVEGGQNLLDALRRGVGDLTPKFGCNQGTCGACTVLIDGQPFLSCLVLAVNAEGRSIETAAGLSDGPSLHPLQQAFIDGFAAQCGYCTPGMLLAAKTLLDRNPNPAREEIAEAISGNLCRCTGYAPIIDAILSAAEIVRRSNRP